jgi:hypothetical protein
MSQTMPSAVPPAACMSATTLSILPGVSERTATFAPSVANNFAVARPIPRPAPATMQDWLAESLRKIYERLAKHQRLVPPAQVRLAGVVRTIGKPDFQIP